MKRAKNWIAVGVIAVIASIALSPTAVFANNRQDDKNTWRNLGIASAVVSLIGAQNHNDTATVLGAVGAAYSADRYEQDRHGQGDRDHGRFNSDRDYRGENRDRDYRGDRHDWNHDHDRSGDRR